MGTKLIIIVALVLGGIAIAQLMRLYELSSKMSKTNESEVNIRDNNLNGKLMLAFMAFLFLGFIWLMAEFGWTGRGEAASMHGKEYDWLLNLNFWIVIIVFFLTNALLFVFAWKYTKKPGVKAFFFPHSNKLELIWTIVPAVVLAVIIILGLRTWSDITSDSGKEAMRVELFAKQFDWTARYAGDDNKLGKFDYKLTTDANELALMTTATIDTAISQMESGINGIKTIEAKLNDQNIMMVPDDRDKMVEDLSRKQRLIRLLYQMREKHNSKIDAMAYDDIIQKDTLYLCENQPYEFSFRAKDVIHSAYFPHFRAQMNAVPGVVTRFKFTPDISTKAMREKMDSPMFNYILMCNKICGGAHYKMKMIVVVLAENEYKDLMKAKKVTRSFKSIFHPAVAPATPGADATTNDSTAVTTVV